MRQAPRPLAGAGGACAPRCRGLSGPRASAPRRPVCSSAVRRAASRAEGTSRSSRGRGAPRSGHSPRPLQRGGSAGARAGAVVSCAAAAGGANTAEERPCPPPRGRRRLRPAAARAASPPTWRPSSPCHSCSVACAFLGSGVASLAGACPVACVPGVVCVRAGCRRLLSVDTSAVHPGCGVTSQPLSAQHCILSPEDSGLWSALCL